MKKYCFGIDVGGTTIKCGLFTLEGELVDKWEITTRIEENGKYILPDVGATINDKLNEKNIPAGEVKGIGIGIPGPVNEDGVVPVAVNLHWGRINIVEDLEKLTSIKTYAANDANVAALGEMWKGGGIGFKNLIVVTLGTGVGGGTLVGLSKKMLNMDNVDHIAELAQNGNLDRVDLKIKDITKSDIVPGFSDIMTASNFGQVSDLATREDIALGIINMVFETIGIFNFFK